MLIVFGAGREGARMFQLQRRQRQRDESIHIRRSQESRARPACGSAAGWVSDLFGAETNRDGEAGPPRRRPRPSFSKYLFETDLKSRK